MRKSKFAPLALLLLLATACGDGTLSAGIGAESDDLAGSAAFEVMRFEYQEHSPLLEWETRGPGLIYDYEIESCSGETCASLVEVDCSGGACEVRNWDGEYFSSIKQSFANVSVNGENVAKSRVEICDYASFGFGSGQTIRVRAKNPETGAVTAWRKGKRTSLSMQGYCALGS